MRNTGLAVQDCSQVAKLADHFTFVDFFLPSPFLSLEGIDPANVTLGRLAAGHLGLHPSRTGYGQAHHGCLYALHMELIFQANR